MIAGRESKKAKVICSTFQAKANSLRLLLAPSFFAANEATSTLPLLPLLLLLLFFAGAETPGASAEATSPSIRACEKMIVDMTERERNIF